jgi:hypothetical protein
MGLLDRFRAQPKWKHADAGIRLAGVEEIPLQDQALLATLAREDADARVRRAAVRKIYDPALLKDVAARDADAEVRDEASGVLLDLALGAFEDSSEAESLKALDHLDDPRHLAAVAKGASAEAVSLAALSRLTDVRAIGSVARRADHASTRLEALARVNEPEEVFAIALRSDHRDVAVAAVERVTSAEHLKALAARATQKAVARRARALVRTIDEATPPPAKAAAPARPASAAPDWDAERDKVCRMLEEASADRDWRAIESRAASAGARWSQIEREAPAGEDVTTRFAAAGERASAAIARLKQEEADRAEQVEQSARQQAERVAICAPLEEIAAGLGRRASGDATAAIGMAQDDVTAQVEHARQAWTALVTPQLSPDDVERVERRFERACGACLREADRCRALDAKRARLGELVDQAEALVGALPQPGPSEGEPGPSGRSFVPGVGPRWAVIKQEWADLGGGRVAGEALVARFDAAQSSIANREAEEREQERQRQREAVERLERACERFETLAKADGLTLKDGERALRDVRSALDSTAPLPKKERGEIADRLKAIQAALFPRVNELREADDWVRWANVGIQEDLCRQVEALREVSDAAEAARHLRDLQQQWKRASAVPRDKAQGLWERFKTAADEVHARAGTFFAQEATERAANLERKEGLCQQAETLAESKDWIRTAEAIKQLQNEWKAIGPVPRGHEKAVWERFRAACDRFFTRRREDLARRKEEWTANLARKEALIAEVESLGETSEWDRGVETIKRVQAEWKTVGPVRKNRSDEVWQRFRAGCDRFFERYQQRDQIQVAANLATREEICREMESLLPSRAGAGAVVAETVTDDATPSPAEDLVGDARAATSEPLVGEAGAVPSETVTEAAILVPAEPPEDLAARVAALRDRWQQAPTLLPRDAVAPLTARFNGALAAVVKAFPEPFRGSELDSEATRRKAEDLCARVERAVPTETERPQVEESPTSILAARLREALAANTIGGVTVADTDARWKAALAVVKEAQAAWAALGALPPALENRFDRACRRVQDAADKRKRP